MPYNPKTNWTPQDAPGPSDFNRIEQGIADATAAAEAAQAAADAAQETADTALSAAQSAGQAAANAQATANTAKAAADAAHAAADAKVPLGERNDEVALLKTLLAGVDTRAWHFTAWTPKGNPTAMELRDGSKVLASATITYNEKEKPVQGIVTYHLPEGDVTVTHNLSWADLTRLLRWEKVVS